MKENRPSGRADHCTDHKERGGNPSQAAAVIECRGRVMLERES
jgi:hypothetical protein